MVARDDEHVHPIDITEGLAGSDAVQIITVDVEDPLQFWVGTTDGLFHARCTAWMGELD